MTAVLVIYSISILAVAIIALFYWRHPPPEGCENCGYVSELVEHRCRYCKERGLHAD